MKRLLVTILIIFNFLVSFSQTENYIEYQKDITEAEALMFDSAFAESVIKFKSTFEKYSFNFPRDCMIAAQVASTINDDTNAFYFLEKGVKFGASKERINIIPRLKRLNKSILWNDFINKYDSLRNIYMGSINWPFRELCYSYTLRDKIWRDKDQKSILSNKLIVLRPKNRKEWLNNSKVAIDSIMKLIPAYGYPSFKTIGCMPLFHPMVNGKMLYISSAFISVIFYHYAPYKDISEYSEILIEEVKNGNLNVRDYALMMEFNNRRENGTKDENSMYYIWWTSPNINKKIPNENEVNKRREDLGLGTCNFERHLKNWQFKYNWEFFYFEV